MLTNDISASHWRIQGEANPTVLPWKLKAIIAPRKLHFVCQDKLSSAGSKRHLDIRWPGTPPRAPLTELSALFQAPDWWGEGIDPLPRNPTSFWAWIALPCWMSYSLDAPVARVSVRPRVVVAECIRRTSVLKDAVKLLEAGQQRLEVNNSRSNEKERGRERERWIVLRTQHESRDCGLG